ncbi:MAG TPA: ATP-binding protein [Pseudolabrys sp.]|jgi:two-component system sensor histidine kinase RegB|nr:ATP-binding protein [Pseudolabrys sp.]
MQASSTQSSIQEIANKKNLLLLVMLRWLAVGGQIATIAFVQLWLDIPLPLVPMGCVLLFLVALNLLSFFRSRQPGTVITNTELFFELLLDVAALTVQLYLSGGATNPFVSLLLVQAVLGAVLLPPRPTWILLVAASGCFILLTTTYWPIRLVPGWFEPLPGQGGHYDLHAYGTFVSFLLAVVLLVLFVTRINGNLRDRDRHLSELRQQSAEEEHIVRMGLLASGAAHELGTPLGTLSVILNDWGRLPALRKDADMVTELGEMNAALERCKDIVSHILLAAGEARGEHFERMTLAGFVEDVVAEWKETRSPPLVDYNADIPDDILIASDTVIRQILLNVFDNALEASPKWVGIEASKESDALVVTVSDKGKGFAPEILANFGKPYQSTKDRAGSGLGLFLVVNVLRKLGGKATARNNRYGGASVELCLPIEALAIDAEAHHA